MARRNGLVFLVLLLMFFLALSVVFPIDKGILGQRGMRLGLDLQGGIHVVYRADLSSAKTGTENEIMEGVIAVLSNRVNPLGVTEPVIYRQGDDRIVVDLPGLTITDKEKDGLSRVALLEFGELIAANETDNATVKWENVFGKWKSATGIIDGEEQELTSRYFKENTFVDQDQMGGIRLVFEWDREGSQLSEQITSRLIGQRLGIFEGDTTLLGDDGRPIAPTVQAVIAERGEITGLSLQAATQLARQLNAGRLPVPLEIIRDQTVSPILGSDFVSKGVTAGLIGVAIVMLFMMSYYRIPGVLASLALIFYAVLNLVLFKLVPVTLTLAGLAGFIVSFGIAVDANVLIFERMKEELIIGRTLGGAIEAGFRRAWSAIWVSNVTTFIVCIILVWLGSIFSAAVQGFGVTLFIGVAISMFTAVLVTRTLLRLFVGTALARQLRLFSPHLGGK
ncbi:MAG: protein translocase subunit SecD [Dehalococcoidales bacterium]|mgnify:FL=1|jgi:preprotein translocase subunit SecD|nr:protein translocase subunit SecD [Dehalococcoidales bacterium]MDP7109693.1 protein translocase subunit SecD [Dehalococcoidales bacterium]MDP7309921.1 protein translocase subunit SecD [Dehalococcoidales bacterium]MDP7409865.1 protein translocase subunit SecD [Dehalococcoidales bacterium]MDP7676231.1 protein translocase subunit SecD [Dehalococcoidales bacterium]